MQNFAYYFRVFANLQSTRRIAQLKTAEAEALLPPRNFTVDGYSAGFHSSPQPHARLRKFAGGFCILSGFHLKCAKWAEHSLFSQLILLSPVLWPVATTCTHQVQVGPEDKVVRNSAWKSSSWEQLTLKMTPRAMFPGSRVPSCDPRDSPLASTTSPN